MKLTDTLAEQEIIERLIEDTKPPVPAGCELLHFLLMTPFRYSATNPFGSRFRRPNAPHGVFYSSEQVTTGVAEVAFYRLLFFVESPATAWPRNPGEYTGFAVEISTERALDLTAPNFVDAEKLHHLVDYAASQAFADSARQASIEVLKYRSVRDSQGQPNFAILSPRAFAQNEPVDRQSWKIHLDFNGVRALCEAPRLSLAFDRDAFSRDPRLAGFNWVRE